MFSENVKPDNNIRNEVFCDSKEYLVGLLVYLNFSFSGAWRNQGVAICQGSDLALRADIQAIFGSCWGADKRARGPGINHCLNLFIASGKFEADIQSGRGYASSAQNGCSLGFIIRWLL